MTDSNDHERGPEPRDDTRPQARPSRAKRPAKTDGPSVPIKPRRAAPRRVKADLTDQQAAPDDEPAPATQPTNPAEAATPAEAAAPPEPTSHAEPAASAETPAAPPVDETPKAAPAKRKGSPERMSPPESKSSPEPAGQAEPAGERIAKVVARAGIASRRDVEAMIAEGRVRLNGRVLDTPAVVVGESDRIEVDGEPLPLRERTRLWLFHKPRGLVTTFRDPEGRPTVFDALPEDLPRVVAVGRLDINTEGLLLLTNDGGLARTIAHPETGWMRRYRVRAHGDVSQASLDQLAKGVTIDDMEYGPVEAMLDRVQGDNSWLTLGLREGKNREVKRILEHLGLRVNRLIRLSFGPFQLGDLEPGLIEEVKTRVLKDQLGATLAEAASVDFASPVREPIAPFGKPTRADEAGPGRKPGQRQPRARDESETRRSRPSGHSGGREDRPSFSRDGQRSPRGAGFGGADRPQRSERPYAGERPNREDRPPGRERSPGERPFGGGRPSFAGQNRASERPQGRPSVAPRSTAWRDGEEMERPRRPGPRREDPRAERTQSAERPRERVAAISRGEGRKVLVERVVGGNRGEGDGPTPRGGFRDGPGRGRPAPRPDRGEGGPRRFDGGPNRGERPGGGEGRPQRAAFGKGRPGPARSGDGERAGPGFKPRGDRPSPGRGPGKSGPFSGPKGAGPRGAGPRGARPGGGPPGGGSRGPGGGGFKGGGKDRRP
jgi:23S rRNA pseudouridine2605 synthase